MWHVWWLTATARTTARVVRTKLGNFWLGLSNPLAIAALAMVCGTVFRFENYRGYTVCLGIGLVLWNCLAEAISSAPTLFERRRNGVHRTTSLYCAREEWAFQLQALGLSMLIFMIGLSFLRLSLWLHLVSTSLPRLFNFVLFLLLVHCSSAWGGLASTILISWCRSCCSCYFCCLRSLAPGRISAIFSGWRDSMRFASPSLLCATQ